MGGKNEEAALLLASVLMITEAIIKYYSFEDDIYYQIDEKTYLVNSIELDKTLKNIKVNLSNGKIIYTDISDLQIKPIKEVRVVNEKVYDKYRWFILPFMYEKNKSGVFTIGAKNNNEENYNKSFTQKIFF